MNSSNDIQKARNHTAVHTDQKHKQPPHHQLSKVWFDSGENAVAEAINKSKSINNTKGAAKNIILFIGDGMGVSTVTAARILAGQQLGLQGEEFQLSFDKFPFSGLAKTYNTNQQTPDSAGTMTAIMIGVKTKAGVIGLDENITPGNCQSMKKAAANLAANKIRLSALELAEMSGKATGIVSTARITHATPAATYAKSPDRDWEDISKLPKAAITAGCLDIADQLIHFESRLKALVGSSRKVSNIDGIDLILGGGRRHFLRHLEADNSRDTNKPIEGNRTDNRNLVSEWKTLYPTGQYIIDKTGFDAIDPAKTNKLLGLFDESHMHYEADRDNDKLGEPSLTEMTQKAIDILDNDKDGFFLMIEAGRIDHGHHAGSAYNALTDTIELSKAVQVAVDATSTKDTLIIVTADHSHVFTIGGYPTRGNPILGKVIENDRHGNPQFEPALAEDGLPYTTVAYRNGRGFKNLEHETDANVAYNKAINAGRKDLTEIDTTLSGYHQESLVPRSAETHGAEDVAIYASGPGAHLISGTNEQNIIFHVMNYAADLVGKSHLKTAN
ncbi:MAG: alkaline phosphatase [Thiotrichaceae bacterium]